MSKTKRFNFFKQKRKENTVNVLRELANRIEKEQLDVVDQGMWNGGTKNVWIFRVEVKESENPVLSEEIRGK